MNAVNLRKSLDVYLNRDSSKEILLAATKDNSYIDKWSAPEKQPDIETLTVLFYVHEIEFEKEKKIQEIKMIAAEKINSNYPLWKQANMLREGGDFSEIDNIREKSNIMEKELDSLKTAQEIKDYKVIL